MHLDLDLQGHTRGSTMADPNQRRGSAVSNIDAYRIHQKINPENVQMDLEDWIPAHIKQRVCCQVVPKDAGSDPVCYCGYSQSEHSPLAIRNKNPLVKEWSVYKNTASEATTAYGDIEFVGFGQKVSKYVRIDHMTDENVILSMMLEHWKLQRPNMLISVTGGAKNFHMRPRLKEVFNRGLMKAAASTGAWIITGGMYAGVMKHVGRAVQDYVTAHGQKAMLNVIGVAPWGCVNRKDLLEHPDGCWPAEYRMEDPKDMGLSAIDRNHSHFIFVDNGTQHQFATEIAFRAKLERAISHMKTTSGDGTNAVSVPAVCVALEGGPGTLETVKSAIQNGTPAVIVEGSGRAADILAYAYANSREEEVKVTDSFGKVHQKSLTIVDDEIWEEVARRIKAEWDERGLAQRVSWVKECLEHRQYMTIFRIDSGNDTKDIDVAILRALLKVNKHQSTHQLRLALTWNRIDVARSDIFTEERKWDDGALNDVMYSAVLNNQVDFVELFMENGCNLREFLNIQTLLMLYNNIPNNCLLYTLLDRGRKGGVNYFSLEDVGHLIHQLMGDFYSPLYMRDSRYKNLDVPRILEGRELRATTLRKSKRGGAFPSDPRQTTLESQATLQLPHMVDNGDVKNFRSTFLIDHQTGEFNESLCDFDEPARELFIFSILLNRLDMAMLFWDEGKEGVAGSLVALNLLKSMLKYTEDSEIINSLSDNVAHFERAAIGVLSQCYVSDEKKARVVLVRQMSNYGYTTTLQLAVKADSKAFIAHTACQSLLNNIWRGRIALDVSTFRMLLCLVCPLLLFCLVKFRQDDRHFLTDHSTNRSSRGSKKKVSPCNDEFEMEKSGKQDSKTWLVSSKKSSSETVPNSDNGGLSWWERIIYFYNAPLIIFTSNCLSYVVFLLYYSFMLLTSFAEEPTYHEYILCFWVFTLFLEEFRQVASNESASPFKKVHSYITDFWNILDCITIGSFIVGMILRSIPSGMCGDCFAAARIILAINLMTFCFRLLHIFSVHKQLGPKLVMIGRMMIDLVSFVFILSVFILAYGLAAQVLLYPNSELNMDLLTSIISLPYWQMYGELFLEEISGDIDCSSDPAVYNNKSYNLPRCPENTDYVVPLLCAGYILFTNILMLNLLIAMFSYTFTAVQDNTDQHWYFLRYSLCKEYHERPPLAPPIIIFSHIYLFFRWLLRCCGVMATAQYNDFRVSLTPSELKQLTTWENLNLDEYQIEWKRAEKTGMEYQVKETNERVDLLTHQLSEIAESSLMLQNETTTTSHGPPKLPPALDDRLTYLEEQMKRTSRALDWIIASMVEKGSASKNGPPKLMDIDQMREEAAARRQQQADKEKAQYQALFRKQLDLHIKARTSHYPCSYQAIVRFNVPNTKVPWDVEWHDYEPVRHTDETVLSRPPWADPVDLLLFEDSNRPNEYEFNKMDTRYGIDRRSHEGSYSVLHNLPYNPKGRTGLMGRGKLGRWGPNHACDPVVTRWCVGDDGDFQYEGDKRVLEFVAVRRDDSKKWAIPGCLFEEVDLAKGISRTIMSVETVGKQSFSREALGNLLHETEEQAKLMDALFEKGIEVYRGYADDPRNTDNSWLETVAINYHDEDGSLTKHVMLQAGVNVDLVSWMKITSRQMLYGSHLAILQRVAQRHDAAF